MIQVTLIAAPQFLDPGDLEPRDDQLQGTDAEKLVETAGRVCYDSFGKGRNSGDYHQHILDVDHGSVTEHAQFTFRIRGISRALSHELVRHRVGVAISQRSTRYVDESETPWALHPALRAYLADSAVDTAERARVMSSVSVALNAARATYNVVEMALTGWLAGKTGDKLAARKQARGAARFYLGNGLETEMVWSANVRALRHVIFMRGGNAADAEIRELAVAILGCVNASAPSYFDAIACRSSADGIGVEVFED
jgi:thymidylate synthase (FAD)